MEQRRNQPSFSLNEFKNWLSQQDDLSQFFDISARLDEEAANGIVGSQVQAKVGRKKLLERIEQADRPAKTLIQDLIEGGGVIVGVDGKNLVVEVEHGSFQIPRFCVRIDSGE